MPFLYCVAAQKTFDNPKPNMIGLGGGLPNDESFPIDTMEIALKYVRFSHLFIYKR